MMKTKIFTVLLALAMIVTGIVATPKEARAEGATTVFWDDGTTGAKKYVITDYWNETTTESVRKVPVKEGYVFAGWYVNDGTDSTKRVPLTEEALTEVASAENGLSAYAQTAYAKFVPAEVLSIKTQVGTSADNVTAMRILSTVDSKNYQAVGFEYKLAIQDVGTTKNKTTGEEITKVYSKIKKSKYDSATYEPGTEFVSGVSKYFIAADVSSIKTESFSKIVYARPYWITMDGTKVMGLARNSRVEDKDTENDYTSVGINLFTDGKVAVAVAAGKIQVTYNSKDYDVVDSTADIAAHAEYGGKYRFPEMECYVNEGGNTGKGTITFVGNADVQNGSLENLLADGLFANVRFKNVSGDANATLDFTINTEETEFCNWAEAEVDAVVVQ